MKKKKPVSDATSQHIVKVGKIKKKEAKKKKSAMNGGGYVIGSGSNNQAKHRTCQIKKWNKGRWPQRPAQNEKKKKIARKKPEKSQEMC